MVPRTATSKPTRSPLCNVDVTSSSARSTAVRWSKNRAAASAPRCWCMALGADPGTVVRMVIAESGTLVLIGVVAGSACAIVVCRWGRTLLYALEPWDPSSLILAAGTLALVSLLAAWIPARRASRIEPTTALRE